MGQNAERNTAHNTAQSIADNTLQNTVQNTERDMAGGSLVKNRGYVQDSPYFYRHVQQVVKVVGGIYGG